jgi:MYXO-CTERM domain-containing protein
MNASKLSLSSFVAATCLAGAVHASAMPIYSVGALSTEGLGAVTGSVEYTYLGSNTGQLAVSLTNTTDPAIGGYITAFMFRTPESMGTISSSMLSSSHPALTNIPAGASGVPFPGSWIGGAGTGGTWLAGGSPNGGVGVGQTGNWLFQITGAMASMLTNSMFVGGNSNTDPYAFIVRFRGMENDGSDKVPGEHVPSPAALSLVALAACAATRRRR